MQLLNLQLSISFFFNSWFELVFNDYSCNQLKRMIMIMMMIVCVQYWKSHKPVRRQDIAGTQQSFQSG